MNKWQDKVYACLTQVPPGRVVTYAGLARAVGCRSARLIGQILRRNSRPVVIPCHRVIRSDLTIGGYQGGRDPARVERKLRLLAAEGVKFDDHGRLLDPARVLY